LQGLLLRGNLRSATALASTSEAMARQVRRLVPELGSVTVTPFGVDLRQFSPRALASGERALTIGIVKTLAPKYGVDLLLRAFAGLIHESAVHGAVADLRLLVVGDGPDRAELVAMAGMLGIASRVEFAGAVPHAEVPSWLHRCDIYAAPSRLDSESFGVAVIEAGACGLPVVVSDAGGLPEVVLDGVTGLVVPREDAAALQAALRRLVLDEALRLRMGTAARAHVAAVYDWERCVDRMLACYLALPRAA
jgi:glycosyltransferase involved in cell wall biosynthesis